MLTINDPPAVISEIDDQLLQADEAPATFDLTSVFSNPLNDDLLFEAAAATPGVVSLNVTTGTLTITPETSGSTAVDVTATDEIGDKATTSFVVAVNTPPIVDTPIADFTGDTPVTVGVPETIDLDTVFSDPDGEALTYTAASDNAGAVTATVDGAILTLDALAAGTATITVTAEDAQGGAVEDTFLAEVNQPPAVDTPVDDRLVQSTDDPFAVDLAAVFSDPDGDALAFTATSSDAGVAAVELVGATATITPVASGTATLTLTADDERGGLTDESFTVTVNIPPIVDTPIDDFTGENPVTVGVPETIDLDTVFSDPDGETLTYTASSNNADAITATVDGAILTLDALAAGTATITVTAEDAQGGAVEDSFLAEVNQLPVVDTPVDDRLVQSTDDPFAVDLATVFSDPDGDALTFAATSSDTDVATVDLIDGTATITPVATGETTLTLTADDERGGLTDESFIVAINTPPTVDTPIADFTGESPVTVGVPEVVTLDPVFSDPDGETLTYTAASDNADAITATVDGAILTLDALAAGTATITVTAEDAQGGAVQDTFLAEVNQLPVVELPLEEIPLDFGDPPVTRDLGPVFTDPDGDMLTFSATSANGDLVSVSVAGETLTIEAVGDGDGSVAVTITAADGRGGITETTVNVVFNIPPPIAEEISDRVLLLGDAALTLNLARFFTDEDGDPINSFEVASDDEAIASAALVGTELELTPEGAGTTAVSVTAISGRGGTTTQTFEVAVIDYPDTVEATITRIFSDATDASNYRLVAIPGDTPLALASTLDGTAGTQWRAFWDDGSDEGFLREYETGSDLFDFVPGRGFWILSQNDWSVTDTRPTVALDNGTFSFDVHEGWNIISNPFDVDVDWDLVQAASEVELLELWRWDGSGGWGTPEDTFASAGTGEAFYVRAQTAGTVTLAYPTSQQAADLRTALDAAPAATPDDVRRLVLGGTLENTEATAEVVAALGTAERAAHSPMPRASFADLQLHLQTDDAPPLYRQRQADDGAGVSFDVEVAVSSPTDGSHSAVMLTPEGLDAFAHTNVHLVDTATSEAYDLHRESQVRLRFEGEQTRRTLRLLIGPDAFVEEALRQVTPDALTLQPNYPNPFTASTTLQFTLPEATHVRLAVYDLLGREVGILADGYFTAGAHEVTWDARTATGTPAGSGVYVARLRAGSTIHTERLVLVR